MSGEDVVGGEAELEFVGMVANLVESTFDQCKSAVRGLVGSVLVVIDPHGQELRGEVALPCSLVVQHAALQRTGEVPVLVEKTLWSVGVGVDDDG